MMPNGCVTNLDHRVHPANQVHFANQVHPGIEIIKAIQRVVPKPVQEKSLVMAPEKVAPKKVQESELPIKAQEIIPGEFLAATQKGPPEAKLPKKEIPAENNKISNNIKSLI